MKLHSANELVELLKEALKENVGGRSFHITGVEAPKDKCAWVVISFNLKEIELRLERDRGEVDIFVKWPDGSWRNIVTCINQILAEKGVVRVVKKKELFDVGYSENEALAGLVENLCNFCDDILVLIAAASKQFGKM